MTRRCYWCGRFVARGTEPVPGYNAHGVRVEQLLCPDDCAQEWRELSARNLARLAEPPR